MVKVSIIVPVYNVEKYIEKCLETLFNQTLKDIEIIIVDDGSNDNSMDIVKKFLSREEIKIIIENNNIKVITLKKENGGLSDARNFGIPHATGKYIAFLDSDDYIEKTMYEEMYVLAEKENSDLVECDFYWEYQNEKTGKIKLKEDKRIEYKTKEEALERIRVVAWNKLIRKEILDREKIIFPKGLRYEDIEFTYKLLPHLEKISYIEKPFIHYIQRIGSISNTQNERTKEVFDVLNNVIEYYKEKNIFEKYHKHLEYFYVRIAFCSSLSRMKKIQDKKIKEKCLKLTMENVNKTFPSWKKNEIIRKGKGFKNLYLKSINKFTYKIYCRFK